MRGNEEKKTNTGTPGMKRKKTESDAGVAVTRISWTLKESMVAAWPNGSTSLEAGPARDRGLLMMVLFMSERQSKYGKINEVRISLAHSSFQGVDIQGLHRARAWAQSWPRRARARY